MRKQDWYMLFIILGVFFVAYNLGGTVTLNLGNGIGIVGGLGAVVILAVLVMIWNDRAKGRRVA